MFRLVELAVFPAAIAHAEFIERYVTPWREFNLDKSINSIWNRRNGGVGHRENKNKINIHLAGRLFAVEPDFSSISFVRGLSLWSDKGSAGKSVEKFPRGQRTRGKPEIMVVSPGSCVLTGVARGSYQNQLHLRASLVRKKKGRHFVITGEEERNGGEKRTASHDFLFYLPVTPSSVHCFLTFPITFAAFPFPRV